MRLCNICMGAQNLAGFFMGKIEYHDCPGCKHWGVRFKPIKETLEDRERLKH